MCAAGTLEGDGFGVESGDIAVIHVDVPLLSVIYTVCMLSVSPVIWKPATPSMAGEFCSVAPTSRLKMWVGWGCANKVAGKVLFSHFKVQPGFSLSVGTEILLAGSSLASPAQPR